MTKLKEAQSIYRMTEGKKTTRLRAAVDVLKGKNVPGEAEVGKIFQCINLIKQDYPEIAGVRVMFTDLKAHADSPYPSLQYSPGFWEGLNPLYPETRMVIARGGKNYYHEILKQREISARIAAELLKIDFSLMQQYPEIFQFFVIGHELGHAHQFFTEYKGSITAYIFDGDDDLDRLPLSGKSAAHAWDMVAKGETTKEIAEKHERAYRKTRKEAYADNFAQKLLLAHWNDLGLPPRQK